MATTSSSEKTEVVIAEPVFTSTVQFVAGFGVLMLFLGLVLLFFSNNPFAGWLSVAVFFAMVAIVLHRVFTLKKADPSVDLRNNAVAHILPEDPQAESYLIEVPVSALAEREQVILQEDASEVNRALGNLRGQEASATSHTGATSVSRRADSGEAFALEETAPELAEAVREELPRTLGEE